MDLNTHRDVSLSAMDYSPLLWGTFLNNITIGFSHTPKPSPMTSGHHTSWSSDMKDNHSLVSRGVCENRFVIDYHLQHPIHRKPYDNTQNV